MQGAATVVPQETSTIDGRKGRGAIHKPAVAEFHGDGLFLVAVPTSCATACETNSQEGALSECRAHNVCVGPLLEQFTRSTSWLVTTAKQFGVSEIRVRSASLCGSECARCTKTIRHFRWNAMPRKPSHRFLAPAPLPTREEAATTQSHTDMSGSLGLDMRVQASGYQPESAGCVTVLGRWV